MKKVLVWVAVQALRTLAGLTVMALVFWAVIAIELVITVFRVIGAML